ncbi:MAG: alpha/beta fold hydrolase [Candidatus Riflebacteria bacterium]|nr:alpha/beta fold hydrolase [Candidatus Riflebacteria bacterium]
MVLLAGGVSAAEPVRLLYLIHGWNGSLESFGAVTKLLSEAQPGLWPDGFWTVIPIEYRPVHRDATLPEQAAACGTQIEDEARKVAARFPDRPREVYFVTHSMGGLILRHLYLAHRNEKDGLGALFADVKRAVLVAPPNQGSDEVRFAFLELEQSLSDLTGALLSDRSLKSLTNTTVKSLMGGIPLEQAQDMAAGSDYLEELNDRWGDAGACERFPAWILAGAHDMVVDLANANLNLTQVMLGDDGRTRCQRCVMDQGRIRYYPYNHSNTNRRDGILGSVDGPAHPVFADLAQILLGKTPPPAPPSVGPSKIFLRLRHPATDRIKDVTVDPFEGAVRSARQYVMSLPEGKVVGFRQRDLVVLAGPPQALMPVSGPMVLILKVKADRKSILPTFLPYVPRILKFEKDYGPSDLIRGREVAYRPIQLSLPPGLVTTNSVLSLTVQLVESPADIPEAALFVPGGCLQPGGAAATRVQSAEKALEGKDNLDLARQLRKLGATQDEALVGLLAKYTAERYPVPLRRAAVAALGDLHTGEALVPIRVASRSTDPTLRAVALDAMGRVPSGDGIAELVDLLDGSATQKDERAALAAIEQAPEPLLVDALSKALPADAPAKRRSRLTALALACSRATPRLMGFVARQALVVTTGRAAPDPYGRILDVLVEHSTPDDRAWVRRMRRAAGQGKDATWSVRLLKQLAKHGAGADPEE